MNDLHSSPHARVTTLPLQSTLWSGGFWKRQFNLCRETILPNIYRLFDADEISHNLANFRIAAGLQEGEHKDPPFQDGDLYKWLEAASYIYGVTRDETLKKLIDSTISLIASVQREDGYIFTKYTIAVNRGEDAKELGNILNFEAYNLGHLITAGCVHSRVTGEDTLLALALKAASSLKQLFEEASRNQSAKTAICPSHYMALIDLYRLTGEKVHLETAELAIRLRDEVNNGTDDNQDRTRLADHDEILGHAVRATYLYSGVSDLYAEMGGEELKAMLMRVWESEEYTKIYINSGCGALYDGVSPSGFAGDHPDLGRTHQSYGRPFELPNITAYNETCATVGNIFFNWRLFSLDAQAIHVDRVEQSFYNLILASVSRDGKRYFYSNPLEREQEKLPYHLKWERTRTPYLSSFCCPPNMLRILAESSEYAYAVSEDTVYTGIYGESISTITLGDSAITLTQETGYPYDGKVRLLLTLEKEREFTLALRIPSWLKGGRIISAGGQRELSAEDANTYIPLKGKWKSGDEIILDMEMPARLVAANPLIEASAGEVAVMRGPLLYCSEEMDQEDVYWSALGIKSSAQFSLERRSIAGEEVVCLLTDDGISYPPLEWNGKRLYQDISSLQPVPAKLSLIPYFAWDNRGMGGMKIWHPLYL